MPPLSPDDISNMQFSVSLTAGDAQAIVERLGTFDEQRLASLEADVEKVVAAKAAIADTVLGLAKVLVGSGILRV